MRINFMVLSIFVLIGIAAAEPVVCANESSVTVSLEDSLRLDTFLMDQECASKPAGSRVLMQFSETPPPDQLTDLAKQAIARAPLRFRNDLLDNLNLLSASLQDMYSTMILSPADPRYTDELAFCIAQLSPENLSADWFIPSVIEENVRYIYEHDTVLQYVRLVDTGTVGVDDDYFTTTFYRVEESGVVAEYELPSDIYYNYIVHPKVQDEPVDYINPDVSGAPHAEPPTGVFWRDWLFTHTEPMPETRVDYPILRDQMAGVDLLWKSKVNDLDNGAIGVINQWVLDVLDFTSGAERPIQPVRVYKLHVGRCGEHQDITTAASRACLIPCLNSEAIAEDHVWNEFWDRRFIHWEPVNVYVDSPLTYENGWGKKFAAIMNVDGDGFCWNATSRYSEGTCMIDVYVEDSQGTPVDGAEVILRKSEGYVGAWAFTGSDGHVQIPYGDEVSCYARIMTPWGKFPSDSFFEISTATVAGETYSWTAQLPNTLPEIPMTQQPVPAPLRNSRIQIAWESQGEIIRGFYNYDKGNRYTQRVDTGSFDLFAVDQINWDLYAADQPFEGISLGKMTDQGTIQFDIPTSGSWHFVFSAERKQNCTQLVQATFRLETFDGSAWVAGDELDTSVYMAPGQRHVVSVEIISELGVRLSMPSHQFTEGAPCYLQCAIGNPGTPIDAVPFFVILDVYGSYFFAPDWTQTADWQEISATTGEYIKEVIPEFTWPGEVGSAENLVFYAAMTDPSITTLLGYLGSWTFGWN